MLGLILLAAKSAAGTAGAAGAGLGLDEFAKTREHDTDQRNNFARAMLDRYSEKYPDHSVVAVCVKHTIEGWHPDPSHPSNIFTISLRAMSLNRMREPAFVHTRVYKRTLELRIRLRKADAHPANACMLCMGPRQGMHMHVYEDCDTCPTRSLGFASCVVEPHKRSRRNPISILEPMHASSYDIMCQDLHLSLECHA